jgi:hypothetical protein
MAFVEYNSLNQYEKKIDVIEAYLMRIIRRYFDTEDLNNIVLREAIVAEAMSRYKSEIDYEMAAVTSLNDKVGKVTLSIFDLKGERSFAKRSAFNKSFGSGTNTICEGDDPRLSDDRVPIDHSHYSSSIEDIMERFQAYQRTMVEITKSYHTHKQKPILDKLSYSGSKDKIDLIIIEEIQSSIKALLEKLGRLSINMENLIEKYLEDLDTKVKVLYDILVIVKENITKKDNEIKDLITQYTDDEIKAFSEYIQELINNKVKCEEINKIIEVLKTVYRFVGDGEVSLEQLLPTMQGSVSSDNGESLLEMYNTSLRIQHSQGFQEVPEYSYWTWDEAAGSFVCTVNSAQYLGFISNNAYSTYEHSATLKSIAADNDIISIILAYVKDSYGDEHTLSLMFAASAGMDSQLVLPMTATIVYDYCLVGEKIITQCAMPLNINENWNVFPNGITAKVIRDEKLFTIYHSDWDSTVLHTEPDIAFSLDDDPVLAKFAGPMRYGYGCKSQQNSEFVNVNFVGYTGTILTDPVFSETDIAETVKTTLGKTISIRSDIKMELYLKYTKNTTDIYLSKLPYMCVTQDLNSIIVCDITPDQKLKITVYPISGESIPVEICKGSIYYKVYAPKTINYISR